MTVQPTRDQLRALADAATPGPWELIGGGEYVTGVSILVAPDDGGVTSADAAFIAAARTAVPQLLDQLDQAEAERDAARGYISELETAVQSRNDVIKHRDARIKAVRELAAQEDDYGDWVVTREAVLRALDT